MKNLLFLLLIIISCSCVNVTPTDNDTIPVTIGDNIARATPDQMMSYYVITDDTYDYYYSPDKIVVKRYVANPNYIILPNWLWLLIVFVLLAIFINMWFVIKAFKMLANVKTAKLNMIITHFNNTANTMSTLELTELGKLAELQQLINNIKGVIKLSDKYIIRRRLYKVFNKH